MIKIDMYRYLSMEFYNKIENRCDNLIENYESR